MLTLGQVVTLADQMPDRYRALVLVTTFACLRWGEVAALERQDIDTNAGTVRIRQSYTEIRGKRMVLGPPKSRAGRRTVSVPPVILSTIRKHLTDHVGKDPTSLVFITPAGRPIWRGNLNQLLDWSTAVEKDLRARMGHDSPQAALIYQHATSEADRAIADALNDKVKATRRRPRRTRTRTRSKARRAGREAQAGQRPKT